MPGPENEKLRNEYLAKLYDAMKRQGLDANNGDVVFEIWTLMKDEKTRNANKDRLTMLSFDYLNNNKSELSDQYTRRKYDTIYSILAVLNGDLAHDFMYQLNSDPMEQKGLHMMQMVSGSDGRINPLEPASTMESIGVKPVQKSGMETLEKNTKNDLMLENLQTLYDTMTKDADPIFHINSKDYKEMVKSIKNTLDYAKLDRNGVDKNVLKEMMKNVSEKTAKYIEAKSAEPSTELGKTRLNAAFATLYTVDQEKMAEMIHHDNKKILQHAQNFDRMMFGGTHQGPTPELIKVGAVIANAGIHSYTKVEKLDRLKVDLEEIKARANASEMGDRINALAEFVVKKGALDTLQNTPRNFNINGDQFAQNREALKHSQAFIKIYIVEVEAGKDINFEAFYGKVSQAVAKEKAAEAAKVKTAEKAPKQKEEKQKTKSADEIEYSKIKKELGLDESATFIETRKAMKNLLKINHDDKVAARPNVTDEERAAARKTFDRMKEIEEVLTDPKKKEAFQKLDEKAKVEAKPEVQKKEASMAGGPQL